MTDYLGHADRCERRYPGPYGARCRGKAGHAPIPNTLDGHAPELDDVTTAPVVFKREADYKAERDEAREQVRSLTTRVDQMETAYRQAEEAVRSLTVERDQWKADRDQAYAFWKREQARADDLAGDFGQCSRDKGALRARLSRAREALAAIDAAAKEGERAQARLPWYGPASSEEYDAAVEAGDRALAALRAALSEPPAG